MQVYTHIHTCACKHIYIFIDILENILLNSNVHTLNNFEKFNVIAWRQETGYQIYKEEILLF